jgi:hypothetical protein
MLKAILKEMDSHGRSQKLLEFELPNKFFSFQKDLQNFIKFYYYIIQSLLLRTN